MKKKLIIGVLLFIIILGLVTYLFTKPINNEYIEYDSSESYKTEFYIAIEEQDYDSAIKIDII